MASFSKGMQAWAKKTGQTMDEVVRDACLHVAQDVVMRTPVGYPPNWKNPPPKGYTGGQARANWNASIGSPDEKITDKQDEAGTSTIAKIGGVARRAPGNVFYIVNALPYIRRLEYEGWSRQSPEGMVRIAIANFNALLRRLAREANGK